MQEDNKENLSTQKKLSVMTANPEEEPVPQPMCQSEYEEFHYKEFADLTEVSLESMDKNALIASLQTDLVNNLDWHAQINSLDLQRSINKYHPTEIDNIMSQIVAAYNESLESLRSSVSKNSMLLAQEFFTNNSTKISNDVINQVIPIQLNKSVTDKGFLRTEAKKALEIFSAKCHYDEPVLVLCKYSLSKHNMMACELATETLLRIIEEMGKGIIEQGMTTMKEVFVTMAELAMNGKRQKMVKAADKMIKSVNTSLGKEKYQDIQSILKSENALSDQQSKHQENVQKEKKKVESSKPDLKALKAQRLAAMKSKQNGNDTIENEFDMCMVSKK